MRIKVKKYQSRTSSLWVEPSYRVNVISKKFCCDEVRKLEPDLKIDSRWPGRLMLVFGGDDVLGMGDRRVFEFKFCFNCGKKVEFVEAVEAKTKRAET